MPKELEEIKGFITGLISSPSTLDVPKESAIYSLNIDANKEQGTLSGISEDKILGYNSWENTRYAIFRLKLINAGTFALSDYQRLWFHFETYNAKYWVWLTSNGATDWVDGSSQRQKEYEDYIQQQGIIEHRIDLTGASDDSAVAVLIANSLTALGPEVGTHLYNTVSTTWFTVQAESIENVIHLKFTSNFYGDYKITPGDSNNYITNHGFTIPQIDGNVIGSGIKPVNHVGDFNFNFIKTIDRKDRHSFLGLFGESLLYVDNLYGNNSNFNMLSTNTIQNDGLNNITSNERNSNLYLGLGSRKGTKTKWVGHIKRKQLDREIDEVVLEDAQCHKPLKRLENLDYDQMVVPTLHSGMNSTNSMIAGAASLYGAGSTAADFGGADVEATGTLSCYRTLNGWIMKSLSNAGIAFQSDGVAASTDDSTFHWDSLKRGMIFRVNIGQEGDATKHTAVQDSSLGAPAAGTALNELRRIKEIGYTDTSAVDSGAAEGAELHDGDLFQVVTVPSGAASGHDTTAASTGNVVTYPRLIYVGSLIGNNTDHDSTNAYFPAPAWAYATRNDTDELARISLAECNDVDITSTNTNYTFSTSGATGETTSDTEFLNRITTVNLGDVIYDGFKIGTISNCASTDGKGGISGRVGSLAKLTIDTVTASDSGGDTSASTKEYVRCHTTTNHSYIIGDWVTISDSTSGNHDGTFQITWVDADEFVVNTGNTTAYPSVSFKCVGITRNYYAGHGKLWVTSSNPNDYNSIWLVDVVNWHGDDADNGRVTAEEFHLSFNKIHDSLISSSPGKGLIEEPYWSKRDPNNPDTEPVEWVDRNWTNYPTDAFIGGVCETYSHQPHLDDGANTGTGNGRWRVWFSYCKVDANETFNRWDLFLYNIRPTEFCSTANDKTANMYDKTPPYQECGSLKLYHTHDIINFPVFSTVTDYAYFPKDKFMVSKGRLTAGKSNFSNGHISSTYGFNANGRPGNNYASPQLNFGSTNNNTPSTVNLIAGCKTQAISATADNYDTRFMGIHCFMKGDETSESSLETGSYSPEIIRDGSSFHSHLATNTAAETTCVGGPMYKDPSGMWHMLESGFNDQNDLVVDENNLGNRPFSGNLVTLDLGSNIGWLNSNFNESHKHPRQVKVYRHCLIPFHLEWFHTGGTDATQEYGSGTASKVAHQINLVTKVNGKLVIKGGRIGLGGSKFDSDDDGECNVWGVRKAGTLSNFVDKNILFTVHDSPCAFTTTSTATDSTTGNTLTDWGGGNEIQGRPGKDTSTTDVIANFDTDKAVAPSLGFSAYNQFRWGHGKNGTDEISAGNNGTAYSGNSRWITWDSYNGDDGYGHFTNITTTWSSASDIQNTKANGEHSANSYIYQTSRRFRGFNIKLTEGTNTTLGTTFNSDEEHSSLTHGGVEGSGYFTYHANKHTQEGSEDTETRLRGFYPSSGGYVLADAAGTEIMTSSDAPLGQKWDNRRIVMCWNTLEADADFSGSYDASDRNKNPRCTMKRIDEAFTSYDQDDLEKGKWKNILSIDQVPIYDTNFSVNKMSTGFIISGEIPNDDHILNMVCVFYNQKRQGIYYLSDSNKRGYTVARPNYKTVSSLRYNHKRCYNNQNMKIKNLTAAAFQAGTGWDLYCPIILGTNKNNTKSILSTWRRSAWPTMVSNSHGDHPQTLEVPAYNYDRFYNMNASDELTTPYGLDNSQPSALTSRFPTEGTSSTAGTNDGETESPAVNNTTSVDGAHYKSEEANLMTFNRGNTDQAGVGEFRKDDVIEYAISYLYDGFQDSPLADQTFVYPGTSSDVTDGLDDNYEQMTVIIRIPKTSRLEISKRITHLVLWRRNNFYENYRFVKQIDLSDVDEGLLDENNNYIVKVVDKKSFETYENLTGMSQTLTDTSLNYSVSTQVNDYLFVTKAFHPSLKDNQNFIFRSKTSKFSIFDWSSDYIALPNNPIALASFAGKLYAFSHETMYKINPDQLFVESVLEGVGILNQNSVVVTDYGMFFCDSNNMYHYDGSKAMPIGDTVIDNNSNPEWSIGYKKAVKKALSKGFSPLVEFDARNKCVYFIIQGYSEGVSSYIKSSSRAYCYSFETGRFDYVEMPAIKTSCISKNGDVILADGYQLWGNRLSNHKNKSWSWDSKLFDLGTLVNDKKFKKLKITGSPTINNFSNSSSDDIRVFIDGIQQNMLIENKNYSVTRPIAGFSADQNWNGQGNADTGAVYSLISALPGKDEITYGATITNSFVLDATSMPEFVSGELTDQSEPVKEGEIVTLKYISPGQYLMMEMTNSSNKRKVQEVVKVTSVNFIWASDNTISRVEIGCERGQLGTNAVDFETLLNTDQNWEHASIRYTGVSLKFPSGAKGKSMQIKLRNQKGTVESISFIYRAKTIK